MGCCTSVTLPRVRLSFPISEQLSTVAEANSTSVEEYLKFMHIVQSFPRVRLAPSAPIEAVWCAHVLRTREYAAFCTAFMGRFYHHSVPATTPGSAASSFAAMADASAYRRTLFLYSIMYNMPAPVESWPQSPADAAELQRLRAIFIRTHGSGEWKAHQAAVERFAANDGMVSELWSRIAPTRTNTTRTTNATRERESGDRQGSPITVAVVEPIETGGGSCNNCACQWECGSCDSCGDCDVDDD